jgi:hypothetical protein
MQISIKMYILVSSFAVTLCTVTDAWLTNYDLNGDFGYHHRNRQVSSTVSDIYYLPSFPSNFNRPFCTFPT